MKDAGVFARYLWLRFWITERKHSAIIRSLTFPVGEVDEASGCGRWRSSAKGKALASHLVYNRFALLSGMYIFGFHRGGTGYAPT